MECLSHPDRGRAAQCSVVSRDFKFDRPVPLERRSLMAPVVATFPLTATSFTAAATPMNSDLGTVTVSREHDRGRPSTRWRRSRRSPS